ncbi:phage lysozyme family protein [Burkholderia thailandensis E254]|uniref:Lysozyme, putative n=1 Tax=Burkholderia thailandensis (strain ATCC 700388 / DSM 13276 / CCUG 48851 / CIP 106301 / E264) TaxID=271848 RepID=Q2T018_BURTA|nr:glycoside hydrolase family protein [Burkholderia thailandensis]ABC38974.1 lysozyme, putative [Burkholderia thailandensis E264]AHI71973.1 phage lysozyme family protein [Burkholderia thailandensis 2002721723]AIP25465.1 phage lysozyme family protein [Burkholderia thailandensis E264]AIT20457.1 phage lysozyme family protein [Burkholderia thailandensis E254]AJY00630.1 phage lysozyme family protein [Burkholderia thailandensis 2002721643]
MSDYDPVKLKLELTNDEGRRARIYTDTVGKVSGGIGRNLTDKGFRDNEIDLMYQNDVVETEVWLDRNLSWWRQLDPVRQRVMMNMAFNMQGRLLGFRNFLAAAQRGDWAMAAAEMLDSLWATQVGARATRLAKMMREGA